MYPEYSHLNRRQSRNLENSDHNLQNWGNVTWIGQQCWQPTEKQVKLHEYRGPRWRTSLHCDVVHKRCYVFDNVGHLFTGDILHFVYTL